MTHLKGIPDFKSHRINMLRQYSSRPTSAHRRRYVMIPQIRLFSTNSSFIRQDDRRVVLLIDLVFG